jgi:hypothetical protein
MFNVCHSEVAKVVALRSAGLLKISNVWDSDIRPRILDKILL